MASWFMKEYGEWLNTPDGKEKSAQVFRFIRDLQFPEHKPPALVTLDDRAVCFKGKWPKVMDLVGFQPWHKRQKKEDAE